MSHLRSGKHPMRLLAVAASAVLLAAALAAPAHAAGAPRADTSLSLIPADAAYYNTVLRIREQIDALLGSKAWAELTKLPAVQFGWKYVQSQYSADGHLAPLKKFCDRPENKELLALLADGLSHEVFVYGGASWADVSGLAMELFGGMRYGPAMLQITGKTRGLSESQLALLSALNVLSQNLAQIKVPDLIIGFKVTDTKKAQAQLDRLEKLLGTALKDVPPLAGRLKRVRVGASNFLSLTLDGSQVPWDMIPVKDVEEKPGEFAPVMTRLKTLKLTVSLGVRGSYLLLAVGPSVASVNRLGKAPRLADRPEFKRLDDHAARRLTSITYVSEALAASVSTSDKDIDGMLEMAKVALEKADLPDARRKAIEKDLAELARDVKKRLDRSGAALVFSFLTERGYEDYAYDFGGHAGVDSSRPLTLLDHVGGNPILAVVGRTKNRGAVYTLASKWVSKAYGHIDAILQDKLGKDEKDKYEEVKKTFLPLVKGFDEVTSKMLLPALADGQTAFVLDAKWSSKQWLQMLPAFEKGAMPLPEVAVVCGVSDAALLTKAAAKYRTLVNDVIAKVREMAPPGSIPAFEVLPPRTKKVRSGTLYFYTLPAEWGVDEQVIPTAGLSDKVLVLAPSHTLAERCLTRTPLRVESGPLAGRRRNLAGALYFNFPALVDAATPWVELGLSSFEDYPDMPGLRKKEVLEQVRTILRVLKCLRGTTSATYLEGGVLVTHSESVLRDLR